MTTIKVNMVAETTFVVDAELAKYDHIITDALKDLLKEHVCYIFEDEMSEMKSYTELVAFFTKVREYISTLFKKKDTFSIRGNPFTVPNTSRIVGTPLTGPTGLYGNSANGVASRG